MVEFIHATSPMIGDIKKAKLEFYQVLSLIKPEHPTLGVYLEGIKCISTIRNKCAHDLNYRPQVSALKPLARCLNKINARFDERNMIETIKTFSANCCGGLYAAIHVIGPTH